MRVLGFLLSVGVLSQTTAFFFRPTTPQPQCDPLDADSCLSTPSSPVCRKGCPFQLDYLYYSNFNNLFYTCNGQDTDSYRCLTASNIYSPCQVDSDCYISGFQPDEFCDGTVCGCNQIMVFGNPLGNFNLRLCSCNNSPFTVDFSFLQIFNSNNDDLFTTCGSERTTTLPTATPPQPPTIPTGPFPLGSQCNTDSDCFAISLPTGTSDCSQSAICECDSGFCGCSENYLQGIGPTINGCYGSVGTGCSVVACRDPNAVCNAARVCECNAPGGFEPDNLGGCRQMTAPSLLDGPCSDDSDCYADNLPWPTPCDGNLCFCDTSLAVPTCSCGASYTRGSGSLSNFCFAGLLAFCRQSMCEDPNSECDFQLPAGAEICLCKDGYQESGGACVEIGLFDQCDSRVDCETHIPFTDCIGDTCQCEDGYVPSGTGVWKYCVPVLGSPCSTEIGCYGDNVVCTPSLPGITDGTCACEDLYNQVGNECVLVPVPLGGSCTCASDCFFVVSGNPVSCQGYFCGCVGGTCQCSYGFEAVGNTCVALYNTPCGFGIDCGRDNTVCDGTLNRCQCDVGYEPTGNFLIPCQEATSPVFSNLGGSCNGDNRECQSTGISPCTGVYCGCVGTVCDCVRGYIRGTGPGQDTNRCYPGLDGDCTIDTDCITPNAVCVPGGQGSTCLCPANYLQIGTGVSGQCMPGRGGTCQGVTDECAGENVVCVADIAGNFECVCDDFYYAPDPNSPDCVLEPRSIGQSCLFNTQCFITGVGNCDGNSCLCRSGTCSCPNGYDANALTCVGRLYADCSVFSCATGLVCDGGTQTCACPFPLEPAADGTCQLGLTDVELGGVCGNNEDCATSNLGQCSGDNTVCRCEAQTCICEPGYVPDLGTNECLAEIKSPCIFGANSIGCADPNAECVFTDEFCPGLCECSDGYVYNGQECQLQLSDLGEGCTSSQQCTSDNLAPGTSCFNGGICDCVFPGICGCLAPFQQMDNECFGVLGSPCPNTVDCTGFNVICSGGQQCVCDPSNSVLVINECQTILNGGCDPAGPACFTPNAVCTPGILGFSNTCECNTGFIQVGNSCERDVVGIGEGCLIDSDCRADNLPNAQTCGEIAICGCDANVCVCDDPYVNVDGNCRTGNFRDNCDAITGCSIAYSSCVNEFCTCNPGYDTDVVNSLCKPNIDQPCQLQQMCAKDELECRSDGIQLTCQCIASQYFEYNGVCYLREPGFGDQCVRPDVIDAVVGQITGRCPVDSGCIVAPGSNTGFCGCGGSTLPSFNGECRGGTFGTEFIFVPPDNFVSNAQVQALIGVSKEINVDVEVTITTRTDTVTQFISNPSTNSDVNDFILTLAVNPSFTFNVVRENGMRIRTNVPIFLHIVSNGVGSSDGFVSWPVSELGQNYIVNTIDTMMVDPNIPNAQNVLNNVYIVAQTAGTSVTVTPKVNQVVGTQIVVVLDELEVYAYANEDIISGTIIEASSPVAVIAGSTCGTIRGPFCDVLASMLTPPLQLSDAYAMTGFPDLLKYSYTIVADFDDTDISVFGAVNGAYTNMNFNLDTGETVQNVFEGRDDSESLALVFISATKPIRVNQFTDRYKPGTVDATGDPSALVIPGCNQWFSQYEFLTVPFFDDVSVSIIIARGEEDQLLLNGNVIDENRKITYKLSPAFNECGGAFDALSVSLNAGIRYTLKTRNRTPFAAFVLALPGASPYSLAYTLGISGLP